MPSHPDRVRTAPLPEDYQFGDGRPTDGDGLPMRPIRRDRPDQIFCVDLSDATPTTIARGIAELARCLSAGTFSAYAELDSLSAGETRYYGAVRYMAVYNPFPQDGAPGMRHYLHVGVIDWTPVDAGDYEPPTLGESYRRACGCHGDYDAAERSTAHFTCVRHTSAAKQWFSSMTLPLTGPGADYRDQHAVAVAESFARNHHGAPAVLPWRAPHLNAAEQLARRGDWNVIEAEHFDSDAERHPVIEGAPVNRSLSVRILNA